jgi:predicted flap endonuclease-1-like 5' DNA nuclease/peptidoglycan hydrolase CwlO-like protein
MPEITVIHLALLAISVAIGAVVGWVVRGNRSQEEKSAINAGWQEQIEAQEKETNRLVERNKGLMEQVSQSQASQKDANNRAKELSLAIQEAFARRDELQREIKDIRSNLEVAVVERDQLQSAVAARSDKEDLMSRKDERIEKLSQELENWQNRLPPLIERFRDRNEKAERLETELATARERIRELETEKEAAGKESIEPVHHHEELTDGLDAPNDPADDLIEENPNNDPESLPEPAREWENESDSEMEENTGGHASRDDLKLIKGVGPAIEKTLNEIGIFRFEQIADMSEYDIDRVANRLRGFHSRIYREDWIGQARDLLDQAANA